MSAAAKKNGKHDAPVPVPVKVFQPSPEVARMFELHKAAQERLATFEGGLKPIVEKFMKDYPDHLTQLAEVLAGQEARVRRTIEDARSAERAAARHHE